MGLITDHVASAYPVVEHAESAYPVVAHVASSYLFLLGPVNAAEVDSHAVNAPPDASQSVLEEHIIHAG